MKMKLVILCIFLSTSLSGIVSLAYAQIKRESQPVATTSVLPEDNGVSLLNTLTTDADFIFQGIVTKIEYQSSNATSEVRAVPHTFVTFKVEKQFTNKAYPASITLRFLGGYDGQGKVLRVAHTPLFDIGDRDILFVSQNGQSACPLVQCDRGRIRIIQDRTFNNAGQPFIKNNQGEINLGERQLLQEVTKNQIGPYIYQRVSSQDNNEDRDQNSAQVEKSAVVALNSLEIEELINAQIQRLIQEGKLRDQPITSVNIQDNFVAPLLKPVKAPEAPTLSETELKQEQERLRQQNQLPSLRRNP